MNEGRFWAWRPWSQAQSGDVSLHPPCSDTACKYTAWQMAWLCGSPPTNLWQAGLMPERLADRPCLIHCHKRHIVYRTERHCNTNTNTPRLGDTLGKPLVCGSGVALKENICSGKFVAARHWNVCFILYPIFSWLSQDLSRDAALVTPGTAWLFLFGFHQTCVCLCMIGIMYVKHKHIYLHASRFLELYSLWENP